MTRTLALGEGEQLVPASDDLLYRQITEHMLSSDGRLGSHAFGPADADHGKPSFSRSSVVTAQASRDWHNLHARTRSRGVCGVTVNDVIRAQTWAIDDSAAPLRAGEVRAPGHCFVDYRGMSRQEEKAVRARLYMAATWIETEDYPDALFEAQSERATA